MDSKTKLYAALVEAQRAAKPVEKDSKNDFHKYKYASAEAMIEEGRGSLSSAGLALFPLSADIVYGNDTNEDSVLVKYLLAHTSGESVEMTSTTPIIVEKGRPADKAVATAKTYDLGYTIRGLLLLPRVEEGAATDARDDSNHVPRRQETQERKAQPQDGAPPSVWARLAAHEEAFGGRARMLEAIGFTVYPKTEKECNAALWRIVELRKSQSKDAAQVKDAPSSAPPDDGPPPEPAPRPESRPPTPLSVVPKETPTQHPGPNANQNRDEAQKRAPNGETSATRAEPARQGERPSSARASSSDEFWRRVRVLDRRNYAVIRKEVCLRYECKDADRISTDQREDYLQYLEGRAARGAQ